MVENNNVTVQFSDDGEDVRPSTDSPPLVSSYNDKIRPILDAVDNLRRLKVTEEGIPLPTIVVVGDQSSGKSSVLENRINNETYEEARAEEAMLFGTHHLLSKIDKSMVGIAVLAEKLVHIQSTIISKCFPDIVKKINERLNASVLELNKLPRKLMTVPDAMAAFIQMVGSLKETLQKILIRGEFDEYANDKQMHCNARLVEMLNEFSTELRSSVKFSDNFLVDEIEVLEEGNGIRLPHFGSHSAFLCLLQRKVNGISELPINFIDKVWSYLENVCIRVMVDNCGNYPQLLPSIRKAAHNTMAKMKAKFVERVVEMIEMEKITDYTCDPNFNASWKKLMGDPHDQFANKIQEYNDHIHSSGLISVDGYGHVNIKHLVNVSENVREQAFDLKMRMTAYWEIVLKRIVDWIALQLQFLIKQMVNTEMRTEIVTDGGIEKMMDEPSSIATRRERLRKSIDLLQESKEVIGQVIDGIFVTAD
ncbi:hypothetical protein L6452_28720 [Arctium lappa]|uniref:Uncharacterized protein n=1 Tax=Arctium lappa TaxID=4217 RepID=A0ACB8ZZ15_ARCLA|nr:hypothetical protein L6452_28720 [Arctium lappa]